MMIEFDNCCDELDWEDLLEDLTEGMKQVEGYNCYWHIEGSNIGWQNRSGYKNFEAETGRELLHEILPNTACNGKIAIEESSNEIDITLYHHDSPTGEFYTLRVATDKEIDQFYY